VTNYYGSMCGWKKKQLYIICVGLFYMWMSFFALMAYLDVLLGLNFGNTSKLLHIYDVLI
jgi:hypothetical protein